MNREYWDEVSADYERSVLSVFDHDQQGLIRERIAAAGKARLGGRAADLGCGVGKFTRLLSESFAEVEACDFSEKGIELARARCADCLNTQFRTLDLACDPMPFDPVDFVLCVNVLLMPSLDARLRAWRSVTNQVVSGGQLLLVVPSLESAQMAYFSEVNARLDAGESCSEAQSNSRPSEATPGELQQGVHRLGDQRSKHYLREELEGMLPSHEFDIEELLKISYPSDPDTRQAETWDWLVLARRR